VVTTTRSHRIEAREIPGTGHIRWKPTIVDAGTNREGEKRKGDLIMAWGNIPDISIRNIIEGLHTGKINPKVKTYVFKLSDGRHLGVNGETELEARQYCDYKNYTIEDLLDIEIQTFNGMTIDEVLLEAKNRGIERGNINGKHF
jgi:hypothetical protein